MVDITYKDAAAKLADHLPLDTDVIGLVDTTETGSAMMQGCTFEQIKNYVAGLGNELNPDPGLIDISKWFLQTPGGWTATGVLTSIDPTSLIGFNNININPGDELEVAVRIDSQSNSNGFFQIISGTEVLGVTLTGAVNYGIRYVFRGEYDGSTVYPNVTINPINNPGITVISEVSAKKVRSG